MGQEDDVRGLVTLLEANRPTVTLPNGSHYLCYLRGKVKRDSGRIMVGDRVWIRPTDPGEAIILQVEPRRNQLVRPPVANIDGIFAVFSTSHPKGSLELLDKRLVLAHLTGCDAEIVLTKSDVSLDPGEREEIARVYKEAGYRVWDLSALTKRGVDEWLGQPRQGIWVLSGESGVGKSFLLQAVLPDSQAVSGDLSRIGRGQQTTRWVRLYPIQNFWLADTPGYTSLEAVISSPQDILPTFGEWHGISCRFANCQHKSEVGCEVIKAVEEGRVAKWRYRHYRLMLEQWGRRY